MFHLLAGAIHCASPGHAAYSFFSLPIWFHKDCSSAVHLFFLCCAPPPTARELLLAHRSYLGSPRALLRLHQSRPPRSGRIRSVSLPLLSLPPPHPVSRRSQLLHCRLVPVRSWLDPDSRGEDARSVAAKPPFRTPPFGGRSCLVRHSSAVSAPARKARLLMT